MTIEICGICNSKYHTSYQHTDTMMKSEDDVRKELIGKFERIIEKSLYTNDDGETHIVKSLLINQLQELKG